MTMQLHKNSSLSIEIVQCVLPCPTLTVMCIDYRDATTTILILLLVLIKMRMVMITIMMMMMMMIK